MPRVLQKTGRLAALGALVAALAWLGLRLGGAGGRGAESPDYRNLVLVTIDTLRADHLSAYGYRQPTSPFIDSLAAEGVLFENAQAASSHTAPSHATMFTALNPESHAVKINGTALPDGIDTLASALGRHGFETAAFTSVGFLSLVGAGFEHFDGGRREASGTTDRAIEWLESLRTHAPVFLWVHLYDVHQYRTSYGPNDARRPKGRRQRLLSYDARITYVDSQIEQLFDRVAGGALEGETLWVITSDHGEGLGDHGYMGHGRHLYVEQLRVPLILYPVPARTAGTRVSELARLLDLRPTVIELLGLDDAIGDEQGEGVSLAPHVLERDAEVGIEYAFAQRRPRDERRDRHGWEGGLVLAGRTLASKYIFFESKEDEFYELRSDPTESVNLIDRNLPEAERLRRWLLESYRRMHQARPGEVGEIQPEFVDELKALGYIE